VIAAIAVIAIRATRENNPRVPQPLPAAEHDDPHAYPLLARFFLAQKGLDPEALSADDLIVVDMEWAHRDPAALREIRRLNPRITILAYVTSEEILTPEELAGVSDYYRYRKELAAGIHPDWYLGDGSGRHAQFFPSTWMVNPLTPWSGHLARFMTGTVLKTGLFDGIYYDNAWASPTWLEDGAIDLDGDGRADGEEHGRDWIAQTWDEGMARLFAETRRLAPRAILMGNGSAAGYERYGTRFSPRHHVDLSGALDEHWPTADENWTEAVDRAYGWLSRARAPSFFVIQADTDGDPGPDSDLQGMRFALGTALLTGSYFAYDAGDHGETNWWYDEYDDAGARRGWLGRPQGPDTPAPDGTHSRLFAHGMVVVNPTDDDRTVTLPAGTWRLIAGRQDPEVNTGQVVTSVTLAPHDARLLVRQES
jgi:hypothetical protein